MPALLQRMRYWEALLCTLCQFPAWIWTDCCCFFLHKKPPSPPGHPFFMHSSPSQQGRACGQHSGSGVAAGGQISWLLFISSCRLLFRGERNPLLRRNADLRLTMTIWLEYWKITLMSFLANSDQLSSGANKHFYTGFLPLRLSVCSQKDWLYIVMWCVSPSQQLPRWNRSV